ncbi:glutathione synthetase, putative [Theileria equi strain WA]|uniref:Glutathione synthetase n=1 Tax=Theileria equi strain WA TaxID=1537102 RepID=L0AYK1_THEEQ|nr:glutathione synthetase, putative [Theileria equi strain WA]AFZ80328.1 glutathione synthetase, putative [Theileria equi strain WA]|eukprot:XP_004829994.1 glutathione synthetase, putative [Theileria equi strain WA]
MENMSTLLVDLLSLFLCDLGPHKNSTICISKYAAVNTNDFNTKIIADVTHSFTSKARLLQNINKDCKLSYSNEASYTTFEGKTRLFNFVLAPLPYPLRIYERCKAFTPIFAQLIDEMCSHLDELDELFSPITSVDPFVKGLLEISREVYGPNGRDYNKDIRVYINRADYILHSEEIAQQSNSKTSNEELTYCRYCLYDYCMCNDREQVTFNNFGDSPEPDHKKLSAELVPKLVEINTIATSFSHASEFIFDLHKELIDSHKQREKLTRNTEMTHTENYPILSYVRTIISAHDLYLSRYPPIFGKEKTCVLLLVDDYLLDDFDIYPISNLYKEHGVVTKIVHVEDLCNLMRQRKLLLVNEWEVEDGSVRFTRVSTYYTEKKPGRLILLNNELDDSATLKDFTGCYEVSVLYYRTWYDPSCIESYKDAWSLRLLCEYSDAVKVPSAPAQLASSKRGQMIWSDPKHIDRLLASHKKRVKGEAYNEELLDAVKETYILQVDPSLDVNAEIVNDAIQNPHRYVLKSQREGGFGVVYNSDISDALSRGIENKGDVSHYVLMKRIIPPTQPSLFARNLNDETFEVELHNSITELGIFGFAVYDGNVCKFNDTDGYLARTRSEFTKGNVCIDMGFINSLVFY